MNQYETILLRVVATEDDKFTMVCSKLVPALFVTFGRSRDKPLDNKLVEVFNHIITRVKANKELGLPAKSLASVLSDGFGAVEQTPATPAANVYRTIGCMLLQLAAERCMDEKSEDLERNSEEVLKVILKRCFATFPIASFPQLFVVALTLMKNLKGKNFINLNEETDDEITWKSVTNFLETAVDFVFIPCNAIDVNLPSAPGLESKVWQVWKALGAKLGNAQSIQDWKMQLLQMVEALCSPKLFNLPEQVQARASKQVEQEQQDDEKLALWKKGFLMKLSSFLKFVYTIYFISSLDQYESPQRKGDILLKRLDGAILAIVDEIPQLYRQLGSYLILRAGRGNAGHKFAAKTLQFVQQRISHFFYDEDREDMVNFANQIVEFIKTCIVMKDRMQVQEAALKCLMTVSGVLFKKKKGIFSGRDEEDAFITVDQTLLELVEHTYFPTELSLVIDESNKTLTLAFRAYGMLISRMAEFGGSSTLIDRVAPKLFSLLDANPQAAEEISEAVGGVLLWFIENSNLDEKREIANRLLLLGMSKVVLI